MKRIRFLIVASMLLFGIGGVVLPTGIATADSPTNVVCTTIGSGSGCATTPDHSLDINHVIAAVINILSSIIGVAAVIMIIIGGFRYITSNGDSSKISSARNTVTYALVGVVIAVLAQALVRFVLDKATN